MNNGFGLQGLSRWLDGSHRAEAQGEEIRVSGMGGQASPAPAAAPPILSATALRTTDRAAPEPTRRETLAAAFDSAHPVQRRRDLFGRDDKLAALFDVMLDQRKHAIIHGARGSGKTSLVRVFGDFAHQRGTVVIYMACEGGESFGELMRDYLRFIPAASLANGKADQFERAVAALDAGSRPRIFVELLSTHVVAPVVFILDEFDRIGGQQVQGDVASFMKLLSDANAPVQLLIVGIARSVSDIIDCHPSLRRHLGAIAVGRITRDDVGLLVDQGAARAGLVFDPAARDLIVRTSCGSPYHARLLALAAGTAALKSGSLTVDYSAALAGVAEALDQWSRLNEADSALFKRLAAIAPTMRARLADIARVAAINDGFTQNSVIDETNTGTHLEGALEGALVSDVRDITRRIFKDSLAPQFLLATIELVNAEESRAAPQPAAWQPPAPPAPPFPYAYRAEETAPPAYPPHQSAPPQDYRPPAPPPPVQPEPLAQPPQDPYYVPPAPQSGRGYVPPPQAGRSPAFWSQRPAYSQPPLAITPEPAVAQMPSWVHASRGGPAADDWLRPSGTW